MKKKSDDEEDHKTTYAGMLVGGILSIILGIYLVINNIGRSDLGETIFVVGALFFLGGLYGLFLQ